MAVLDPARALSDAHPPGCAPGPLPVPLGAGGGLSGVYKYVNMSTAQCHLATAALSRLGSAPLAPPGGTGVPQEGPGIPVQPLLHQGGSGHSAALACGLLGGQHGENLSVPQSVPSFVPQVVPPLVQSQPALTAAHQQPAPSGGTLPGNPLAWQLPFQARGWMPLPQHPWVPPYQDGHPSTQSYPGDPPGARFDPAGFSTLPPSTPCTALPMPFPSRPSLPNHRPTATSQIGQRLSPKGAESSVPASYQMECQHALSTGNEDGVSRQENEGGCGEAREGAEPPCAGDRSGPHRGLGPGAQVGAALPDVLGAGGKDRGHVRPEVLSRTRGSKPGDAGVVEGRGDMEQEIGLTKKPALVSLQQEVAHLREQVRVRIP